MEEIEYLEEYEDLVLPAINSAAGAAVNANSSKFANLDNDGSSSSLDQDIFNCLFDDNSDEDNEEPQQTLKEGKIYHQKDGTGHCLDETNNILNDIGDQIRKELSLQQLSTISVKEKENIKATKQTTFYSKSSGSKIDHSTSVSSLASANLKTVATVKPTVQQKANSEISNKDKKPNRKFYPTRPFENIKSATSKQSLPSKSCVGRDHFAASTSAVNANTSVEKNKFSAKPQTKPSLDRQRPATIVKPEKVITKDPAEDPLNLDDLSSAESANYSVSDISGETYNSISDFDDDDYDFAGHIDALDDDDEESLHSEVIDISNDSSESLSNFEELRGITPSPVVSEDRTTLPKLMANHEIIKSLLTKGEKPKLLPLINKLGSSNKYCAENRNDNVSKNKSVCESSVLSEHTSKCKSAEKSSISSRSNVPEDNSKDLSCSSTKSSCSEVQPHESMVQDVQTIDVNNAKKSTNIVKTSEKVNLVELKDREATEIVGELIENLPDENRSIKDSSLTHQNKQPQINMKDTANQSPTDKDCFEKQDEIQTATSDEDCYVKKTLETPIVRPRKKRFRNLTSPETVVEPTVALKDSICDPSEIKSNISSNPSGLVPDPEAKTKPDVIVRASTKPNESFKTPTKVLDKSNQKSPLRGGSSDRLIDTSKDKLNKQALDKFNKQVMVNPFVQRSRSTFATRDGRTKISKELEKEKSRESSVESLKNCIKDKNRTDGSLKTVCREPVTTEQQESKQSGLKGTLKRSNTPQNSIPTNTAKSLQDFAAKKGEHNLKTNSVDYNTQSKVDTKHISLLDATKRKDIKKKSIDLERTASKAKQSSIKKDEKINVDEKQKDTPDAKINKTVTAEKQSLETNGKLPRSIDGKLEQHKDEETANAKTEDGRQKREKCVPDEKNKDKPDVKINKAVREKQSLASNEKLTRSIDGKLGQHKDQKKANAKTEDSGHKCEKLLADEKINLDEKHKDKPDAKQNKAVTAEKQSLASNEKLPRSSDGKLKQHKDQEKVNAKTENSRQKCEKLLADEKINLDETHKDKPDAKQNKAVTAEKQSLASNEKLPRSIDGKLKQHKDQEKVNAKTENSHQKCEKLLADEKINLDEKHKDKPDAKQNKAVTAEKQSLASNEKLPRSFDGKLKQHKDQEKVNAKTEDSRQICEKLLPNEKINLDEKHKDKPDAKQNKAVTAEKQSLASNEKLPIAIDGKLKQHKDQEKVSAKTEDSRQKCEKLLPDEKIILDEKHKVKPDAKKNQATLAEKSSLASNEKLPKSIDRKLEQHKDEEKANAKIKDGCQKNEKLLPSDKNPFSLSKSKNDLKPEVGLSQAFSDSSPDTNKISTTSNKTNIDCSKKLLVTKAALKFNAKDDVKLVNNTNNTASTNSDSPIKNRREEAKSSDKKVETPKTQSQKQHQSPEHSYDSEHKSPVEKYNKLSTNKIPESNTNTASRKSSIKNRREGTKPSDKKVETPKTQSQKLHQSPEHSYDSEQKSPEAEFDKLYTENIKESSPTERKESNKCLSLLPYSENHSLKTQCAAIKAVANDAHCLIGEQNKDDVTKVSETQMKTKIADEETSEKVDRYSLESKEKACAGSGEIGATKNNINEVNATEDCEDIGTVSKTFRKTGIDQDYTALFSKTKPESEKLSTKYTKPEHSNRVADDENDKKSNSNLKNSESLVTVEKKTISIKTMAGKIEDSTGPTDNISVVASTGKSNDRNLTEIDEQKLKELPHSSESGAAPENDSPNSKPMTDQLNSDDIATSKSISMKDDNCDKEEKDVHTNLEVEQNEHNSAVTTSLSITREEMSDKQHLETETAVVCNKSQKSQNLDEVLMLNESLSKHSVNDKTDNKIDNRIMRATITGKKNTKSTPEKGGLSLTAEGNNTCIRPKSVTQSSRKTRSLKTEEMSTVANENTTVSSNPVKESSSISLVIKNPQSDSTSQETFAETANEDTSIDQFNELTRAGSMRKTRSTVVAEDEVNSMDSSKLHLSSHNLKNNDDSTSKTPAKTNRRNKNTPCKGEDLGEYLQGHESVVSKAKSSASDEQKKEISLISKDKKEINVSPQKNTRSNRFNTISRTVGVNKSSTEGEISSKVDEKLSAIAECKLKPPKSSSPLIKTIESKTANLYSNKTEKSKVEIKIPKIKTFDNATISSASEAKLDAKTKQNGKDDASKKESGLMANIAQTQDVDVSNVPLGGDTTYDSKHKDIALTKTKSLESLDTLTTSKSLNDDKLNSSIEVKPSAIERARRLRTRGSESPLCESKTALKTLTIVKDIEATAKRRLRSPAAEKELQAPATKKFKIDKGKGIRSSEVIGSEESSIKAFSVASKQLPKKSPQKISPDSKGLLGESLSSCDGKTTYCVENKTTENIKQLATTNVDKDTLPCDILPQSVENKSSIPISEAKVTEVEPGVPKPSPHNETASPEKILSFADWLKGNDKTDSSQLNNLSIGKRNNARKEQMDAIRSSNVQNMGTKNVIEVNKFDSIPMRQKSPKRTRTQIKSTLTESNKDNKESSQSTANKPEIKYEIPGEVALKTTENVHYSVTKPVTKTPSPTPNVAVSFKRGLRKLRTATDIPNVTSKEATSNTETNIPKEGLSESKIGADVVSSRRTFTTKSTEKESVDLSVSTENEFVDLPVKSITPSLKPGRRIQIKKRGAQSLETIFKEPLTKDSPSSKQDKKSNKRSEIDMLIEAMPKEMKEAGIKDLLKDSGSSKRQRTITKKSIPATSTNSINATSEVKEQIAKEAINKDAGPHVMVCEMSAGTDRASKTSPTRRSLHKKIAKDCNKTVNTWMTPKPIELEKTLIDDVEIKNMNTSLLETVKNETLKSQILRRPTKCRKLKVKVNRHAVEKYLKNLRQMDTSAVALRNDTLKNTIQNKENEPITSTESRAITLTTTLDKLLNMPPSSGGSTEIITNFSEVKEISKEPFLQTTDRAAEVLRRRLSLITPEALPTSVVGSKSTSAMSATVDKITGENGRNVDEILAESLMEPLANIELKNEFLDENPNCLVETILPDTPTLIARSQTITQAAANALSNTIMPTDIRLLTNDPKSTRAYVPSFGVMPTLVDAKGTRMYTFLHPAKYSRNHGNVLLDYCCPNLDGPMPAIDPTRIHAQVQTPVIEVPSCIVLTTKVVTRAELESKTSTIPAVIRKKAEKLRSKIHAIADVPQETTVSDVPIQSQRLPYLTRNTTSEQSPEVVNTAVVSAKTTPQFSTKVSQFSPAINALAKHLPPTTTITAKIGSPTPQSLQISKYKQDVSSSVSVVQKGPKLLNESQMNLLHSNLKRIDTVLKSLVQPFGKLNYTERHQIIDSLLASGKFLPKDLDHTIVLMEEYLNQINLMEGKQILAGSTSSNIINAMPRQLANLQSIRMPTIQTAAPNLAMSTVKADNNQKLDEVHNSSIQNLQSTVIQSNATVKTSTIKQRQVPIYDTEKNIIGYQLQVITPTGIPAYSKSTLTSTPEGITPTLRSNGSTQRKSLKRPAQESPRIFYTSQPTQTSTSSSQVNSNSMHYLGKQMGTGKKNSQTLNKSQNGGSILTTSGGSKSAGTETITTTTTATVKRVTRSRAAGSKIIIVSKLNSNEETILPDVSHQAEIKHEKEDFIA